MQALASRDGSEDNERFFPAGDRFGHGSVWGLVGQILFAGEEAQEWTALQRAVIANGAAQHRVAGFEGVEDGALRNWGCDFELRIAGKMGQRSQVGREDNADHGILFDALRAIVAAVSRVKTAYFAAGFKYVS